MKPVHIMLQAKNGIFYC